MTTISGAEIAMWDLIGKACGQPVYRLIGGCAHETVHAYANGWYGGCRMPAELAARAAAVGERGYTALKFDPFTTAWKVLDSEEEHAAIEIIDAVARAVGPKVGLMIEIHGRLAVGEAIRFIRRLASHDIVWCEEPVAPEKLDLLKDVKAAVQHPIAADERLYALADFARDDHDARLRCRANGYRALWRPGGSEEDCRFRGGPGSRRLAADRDAMLRRVARWL